MHRTRNAQAGAPGTVIGIRVFFALICSVNRPLTCGVQVNPPPNPGVSPSWSWFHLVVMLPLPVALGVLGHVGSMYKIGGPGSRPLQTTRMYSNDAATGGNYHLAK